MPEICSICSNSNARYLMLDGERKQVNICVDCTRHIKNPVAIMDNPKFWSEFDENR